MRIKVHNDVFTLASLCGRSSGTLLCPIPFVATQHALHCIRFSLTQGRVSFFRRLDREWSRKVIRLEHRRYVGWNSIRYPKYPSEAAFVQAHSAKLDIDSSNASRSGPLPAEMELELLSSTTMMPAKWTAAMLEEHLLEGVSAREWMSALL
ncbi:hypothetical protein DL93DRAFT_1179118 [Clavulina sp. PMI_390]|nr:hypothetical protein DL93DRAFT_1179118 [Clavulina sp. PMI_390]